MAEADEATKLKRVLALGIAEGRAREIAKKEKLYVALMEVVDSAGVTECDKKQGTLLQTLSTKFPKGASKESRQLIAQCIVKGLIDVTDRLNVALAVAEEAGLKSAVSEEVLAERCKFGVVYAEEDVEAAVRAHFDRVGKEGLSWDSKNFEEAKRPLVGCDGRLAKAVYDRLLTEAIGPAPKKEKKPKKEKGAEPAPKGAGKKKAKQAEVAKLDGIRVELSNTALAEDLMRIAEMSSNDRAQRVAMIADTLAAIKRDSYAKGMASGNLDPRNGVRLPTKRA